MKTKSRRERLFNLLMTLNVILYSFLAACFTKSGVGYAQNIPDLKNIPQKIHNLNIQKVTVAEQKEILDVARQNYFPWGQCTWYVATKRNVTWNGNARDWYENAKRAGKSVGKSPIQGAIIVLDQGYYGHVGFVESVGENSITFSESNNPIPGKITTKTINNSNKQIIGFIY